jgi:SAM-dependent methyltransferase
MDFNYISKNTLKRYTDRYNELGKNIRTLGWGSSEQQELRFINTLRAENFDGKSVIDIGCGFGDYYSFLLKQGIKLDSYIGTDINESFINESKKSYSDQCEFITADILSGEFPLNESFHFDIGVMLGLLNYNLQSSALNYEYSKKMITNAFSLVDKVLIVDFLSSKLFDGYPKEDFVFYHEPKEMFEFALSLSSNVSLIHDYEPIPQKEFMLFIYK